MTRKKSSVARREKCGKGKRKVSHNVDEVCNPEDNKSARECLSDMIEEIESWIRQARGN